MLFPTYVSGTLVEYTIQKITKSCIALADKAGMQLLSNMAIPCPAYNLPGMNLRYFPKEKTDDSVPRLKIDDLAEASDSVN